mmetsp:Transcript_67575/g.195622  ORF Transcript_67575/g.195622 Transcript_67575/m.195622 type:complete len:246 (+) Transcript_67575:1267-2004(+)
MEQMMAVPFLLARTRSSCAVCSALLASSPEVGSSRNSTGAPTRSFSPMPRRFRWPVEMPRYSIPPTKVFRQEPRPRTASTHSTRRLASALAGQQRRAATMRHSSTVRASWKGGFSMQYCITFRRSFCVAGLPPRRISPMGVPLTRPPRQSSNVVLPAPEGPIKKRTCPDSQAPDTSCKTVTCCFFLVTVYPTSMNLSPTRLMAPWLPSGANNGDGGILRGVTSIPRPDGASTAERGPKSLPGLWA